jgi:hypothetical protein
MNDGEKQGALKMAIGLFGALLFCVLGFAWRRRAWVSLACLAGVAGALLFAYTGFVEYRGAHLYGQRYGDAAVDVTCKDFAIGSFFRMPQRCKVIDGQDTEQR